jgi:hypothetical protein
MNELELKDQVKRGERARQLLKDPMIQDFLKELRETIYHNIRTSHFKDKEEREDLYKILQVTDRFEGLFNRHINTGKLASSKLDQLKERFTKVTRLKSLP